MSAALALAAAPAGLLVALYLLRRQVTPLALYAATVPFGSALVLPLPLPGPFATLSSTLGVLALFTLMFALALSTRPARRLDAPALLFLLVVAWLAWMSPWAVDLRRHLPLLAGVAGLAALYVVVTLLHWRLADLRRLETWIVVGGFATGLYALVLQATGTMTTTEAGEPRFALSGGGEGTADPNLTAAALLLPLILAVSRMIQPGPLRTRALAGVAAGAMITAVVLTGSRGGLMGALAALAVQLAAGARPSRSITIAIAVLASVGVLTLVASSGALGRFADTSSTGRTDIWRIGMEVCAHRCVAGAGLGGFAPEFGDLYLASASEVGRLHSYEAHSTWLSLAVEAGAPGLVLFVSALVLLAWAVWRLPAALRGAPLAALAGLVVSSSFLSALGFKYFWLVLVYAAVAVSVADAGRAGARRMSL